ncbi:MAG: cytochrome c [Deltaproteobacteria bacterium]
MARQRPFFFERRRRTLRAASLLLLIGYAGMARGDDTPGQMTPAERGFHWLTTKPYLPADFDQEVFENLWKVWPAELRDSAREASPEERRRLAFSRYGLMEPPYGETGRQGQGPALGYVSDGRGGWVMNCLACHAGKVAGRVIPGLPNSHYLLETLTEDVRLMKLKMGKPLTHMDKGSLTMPLGTTRGTTNSVMFGVALGALRDKDLNMRRDPVIPVMLHNDVDAPPFWNVRRKKRLYSDGFAIKSHRPLLQFVMLPRNSGETLRGWEEEFRDILAWIESLEAPAYPWEIDRPLAETGRIAFERTCARCHGTYGEKASYPDKIVPIDEVKTDPARLKSLTTEHRRKMQEGWFGDYGREPYIVDPGGYAAPPLNGIWASAPYLHNGSVPTLWHVMHPDERPAVWSRTEDGYDRTRVGLEVTTFEKLPESAKSPAQKREFFDTRLPGKSAAGHPFPDELTEAEKHAVIEYLKTL